MRSILSLFMRLAKSKLVAANEKIAEGAVGGYKGID